MSTGVEKPMMIGEVLKKWRIMNERVLRDVSKEIGIAPATLMRLEQGHDIDSTSWMRVMNWLMSRDRKAA